MVDRYTKLRVRRNLRRKQRVIKKVGDDASNQFERHVVRRWRNFREVQRFAGTWLLLVFLLVGGVFMQSRDLSALYTREVPSAGGIFREGVLGEITNVNPIYATNAADRAAAKLLFSSLLRYDEDGNLIGDLARSWSVNDDGTVYTVNLQRDIAWHDGRTVTADDVVFTYEMIQHPDALSFLNASWRDITVQAKDDFTVTFALPNPFTPFPHSLARGGILPKHILGEVDPGQLRGHPFNASQPVGTGPFQYVDVVEIGERPELILERFDRYHFGKPMLEQFVIVSYEDQEIMTAAFESGELAAMAGLNSNVRGQLEDQNEVIWYDLPLYNGVYMFYNLSNSLLADEDMRQALTKFTDRSDILDSLEARYLPAEGPILSSALGYDESSTQFAFNPDSAGEQLDALGWVLGEDGFREKDGERLSFELVAQNSDDYPAVASMIRDQWSQYGIEVRVTIVNPDDIQQSRIVTHNYQILLFGITMGVDPDVFVYWHSSQSGVGGFNLSEYENTTADAALESGRTRRDASLRAAKYETFQAQWRNDTPATALYQPGFAYVQHSRVTGFDPIKLTTPNERFYSVHEWTVSTRTAEKVY